MQGCGLEHPEHLGAPQARCTKFVSVTAIDACSCKKMQVFFGVLVAGSFASWGVSHSRFLFASPACIRHAGLRMLAPRYRGSSVLQLIGVKWEARPVEGWPRNDDVPVLRPDPKP